MPQKGKGSSSLAYCVCLNCALGPSCVLMQLSLDFPATPYKVNIFPHGFLKFLREISGQPQGGRGGRAGIRNRQHNYSMYFSGVYQILKRPMFKMVV